MSQGSSAMRAENRSRDYIIPTADFTPNKGQFELALPARGISIENLTGEHDVIRLSGFAIPRDEALALEPDAREAGAEMDRDLEALESRLEEEILYLSRTQHEFENDDAIGALEAQLKTIREARDTARSGDLSAIRTLAVSMPAIQSAAMGTLKSAAADASYQTGASAVELTLDKIEKMSISSLANSATARTFADMSQAQLDAVAVKIDSHVSASFGLERDAHNRIEAAAATNGADLSAYRQERARLRFEEEEARRTGDRIALARAAWLQTENSVIGAQTAGLSEAEIDARRRQAVADEQAFRLEVRRTAAEEAKEKGLNGKAAEQHIVAREQEEVGKATERREQIFQAHGITSPQDQEAEAAKVISLDALNQTNKTSLLQPSTTPISTTTTSTNIQTTNVNDTAQTTEQKSAQALGFQFAAIKPKDGTTISDPTHNNEVELGDLPKAVSNQSIGIGASQETSLS